MIVNVTTGWSEGPEDWQPENIYGVPHEVLPLAFLLTHTTYIYRLCLSGYVQVPTLVLPPNQEQRILKPGDVAINPSCADILAPLIVLTNRSFRAPPLRPNLLLQEKQALRSNTNTNRHWGIAIHSRCKAPAESAKFRHVLHAIKKSKRLCYPSIWYTRRSADPQNSAVASTRVTTALGVTNRRNVSILRQKSRFLLSHRPNLKSRSARTRTSGNKQSHRRPKSPHQYCPRMRPKHTLIISTLYWPRHLGILRTVIRIP